MSSSFRRLYKQGKRNNVRTGMTFNDSRARFEVNNKQFVTAKQADWYYDYIVKFGHTFEEPNENPLANAGSNQTVASGALVTLTAAASSDPDGDAITYAWTQTSGTSVTLSSSTAASPTFTAPSIAFGGTAQNLVFSLVVTDSNGAASTADTVTITVNPATPPLGLTSSLLSVSGETGVWQQQTIDLSAYAGVTARPVFHYTNGDNTYYADLQIDSINFAGNSYGFESNNHGFETSYSTNSSSYNSVTWQAVPTTTASGKWNRHTGNTGSTSTGNLGAQAGSYYVYAETSSPANVQGYNFWLRGPAVTIPSNSNFTFYEGREGQGMGTLNVHLYITSV